MLTALSSRTYTSPLLPLSAAHSITAPSFHSQRMSTLTGRGGRARAPAQRLHFRSSRKQAASPSVSDTSESDADDRDREGGGKYDPVITNAAFDEYYKVPSPFLCPSLSDSHAELLC